MGSDNMSSRPKARKIRLQARHIWLVLAFFLPLAALFAVHSGLPKLNDKSQLPFEEGDLATRTKGKSSASKHHSHKPSPSKHHSSESSPGEADSGGQGACTERTCPQIHSISPSHGPAAGGYTVTITGKNLGTGGDSLQSVSIGGMVCVAFHPEESARGSLSASTSLPATPGASAPAIPPPGTQVTCTAPRGTGVKRPVSATVRTSQGFLTGVSEKAGSFFSYDPPKVTSVEPNHGPRIGGTTVLIRGLNFGVTESYPIATIGDQPCQATRWISNTLVRCVTPAGRGVRLSAHVTVCGCGEAVQAPQSSRDRGGSAASSSAVFSYDEDTMQDSGRAILHKIDLKPTAKFPLTLNRKQLTHDYEVSYIDPMTSRRHFYAVPPELSTVIPLDDFRHRYDTCAVVGSSGSLVNSGVGAAIDEHDAVFRVHNSPTHRFETDVGSKTSFQIENHYWMEMLMSGDNGPSDSRWWVEDSTLVLWSQFSQEAYVQLRQLYPTSPIMFLSRNLVTLATSAAHKMMVRIEEAMKTNFSHTHKEQTSMFYATVLALQVCHQVDIYGADFRSSKYHYYDDYDPGDDERQLNTLEYLILLGMRSVGLIHHISEHTPPPTNAPAVVRAEDNQQAAGVCLPRECTNDCSHHGQWKNGTCICEPIFAGSDCSINLMQRAIPQLLAGLNTTYSGSLVLNKGEVNTNASGSSGGGIIQLPNGIAHQKLREGDVYKVDRALYHVLQDEDGHERYGTCAIVGNSGNMLNHELGRVIDSHDFVYRFNQAPVKGFEVHVGSRTTYESLNGFWVKELMDEKRGYRWNWRSRDTGLVLFELFEPWAFIWKTKTQIYEKDRWWKATYVRLRKMHPDRKIIALSPQFVSWSYLLYRELRRRFQRLRLGHYPGEKPMSGFYAFFYALQVCENVNVYGFAPYREPTEKGLEAKYHYFDGAVPRPGSHSFDLAHYIYHLFAMQHDNVQIID